MDDHAIPVTLLPGLEIALDQIEGMDDSELSLAALGSGRWLLLEMPSRGWPLDLPEIMTALEIRGFRVVLAHPERNESVQGSPGRLRELVGRGALVQVTALAITGGLGTGAQRSAVGLIRSGLAHVIASDMHNTWGRVPGVLRGLTAAAAALRTTVTELAWMVRDVPQAIVSGDDVRVPHSAQSG
jgi:protein-tyrosine phosphatase